MDNPVIPMDKPLAVTDETFEEAVINYSKEMPVVVDFWAEWCGPCRMVAPVLDKLAGEYAGRIRIAKVDTDANMGLSQAFQIMSIPTIMIVKEGHIIFAQPGALHEVMFRDLFDKAIALDIAKALAEHAAVEETVEAVAETPVEAVAEAPAKPKRQKKAKAADAEAKPKKSRKKAVAEAVGEATVAESKPKKSRKKNTN